jgi:S-adenosylmethionine decarboxylase proenzyme
MELWGCKALNSVEVVELALRQATEACGATLLDLSVHPFSPVGITGVAVVSESHIVIHTWPEYGYAAVDVFTCGDSDPVQAIPVFRHHFAPAKSQVMVIERGIICPDKVGVGCGLERGAELVS